MISCSILVVFDSLCQNRSYRSYTSYSVSVVEVEGSSATERGRGNPLKHERLRLCSFDMFILLKQLGYWSKFMIIGHREIIIIISGPMYNLTCWSFSHAIMIKSVKVIGPVVSWLLLFCSRICSIIDTHTSLRVGGDNGRLVIVVYDLVKVIHRLFSVFCVYNVFKFQLGSCLR